MNQNLETHSPVQAATYLCMAFITGFLGWINWTAMAEWFKFISFVISSIAGVMAITYYFYSIKEKKLSIKKTKGEI